MLCWSPRKPSPTLSARLFPEPEPARAASPTRQPNPGQALWPWLAPAMALFVLTLVFLGRNPRSLSGLTPAPTISLVATVAVSHAHLMAYYEASRHSDRNTLSTDTFAWTKRGGSLTTSPPFFNTNGLTP